MSAPNKVPEESTVISHIYDLIKEMPPGEQHALLEELKERSSRLKRKHHRKAIRSSVEYTTKHVTEKGIIQNISTGGVFIETRIPFHKGEDISFNFVSPINPEEQLKIHGKIVRVSSSGVGIEFEPLNEGQKLLIKSHLEIL